MKTQKEQINLTIRFRQDASIVEEHALWDRLFDILGIFDGVKYVKSDITKTNLVPGDGLMVKGVATAPQSISENGSYNGINGNQN